MSARARAFRFVVTVLAVCAVLAARPALAAGPALAAQAAQAAQAPQPPQTAQAMAPIDLTGYWVAVISEDWRWRMITPAKGDFPSVPMTAEGFTLANTWDPAKDEAAGEQCRSYGAPGLMRGPIRLHITWLDADTLKIETDYGMQTRLFHFGSSTPPGGPPTWQGNSVAKWNVPAGAAPAGAPKAGSLTVTTDHLRAGYLRKNGVPYSANALLTEFWDQAEQNGVRWIVITSIVHDPKYLLVPFTTSLQFKKEADGAKWDPTPCSARW